MTRLKVQTLDAHRALEASLPLLGSALTLADYRQLLTHWHSVLAPLEDKLSALPLGPALRWPERQKSHLLRADLDFLGGPTLPPPAPQVPDLNSTSALGALYVLEGSTLGGQLISRHLHAQLGVTPETGGLFFCGYGQQTGPMWKDFAATLEELVLPQQEDEVVAGALAVFQTFHKALSPLKVAS